MSDTKLDDATERSKPRLSDDEFFGILAKWDKEPPRRLTRAEKIAQMDEWDFENGCERPHSHE